jgi:hypothetical protein
MTPSINLPLKWPLPEYYYIDYLDPYPPEDLPPPGAWGERIYATDPHLSPEACLDRAIEGIRTRRPQLYQHFLAIYAKDKAV